MQQVNPKSYWTTVILVLLGVLAILPFLLLNLYNHPSNDDFLFATRDETKSFIATQIDLYMNWSGRYFGTASSRINPIIEQDFILYKLYSFVVICLYVAAIVFFFYSILRSTLSNIQIAAVSLVFCTVSLATMPDIAQGLYWFSGYITYLGPIIYTLVLFGLLYRLEIAKNRTYRIILVTLSFILVFAIAGANELSMIILNASLLLITLSKWLKTRKISRFYLTLFLFALILGLIVVLAPGNYIRMEDQVKSGSLILSFGGAVLMTGFSFLKWGFLMMLVSLLYLFTWAKRIAQSTTLSSVFQAPVLLTIAWFLSTIFVMHFLFIYATGFRAGTRVENVIHFFFVFGWLYLLQVLIYRYQHLIFNQIPSSSPLVTILLTVMLWVQVFDINSNVTTAYLDIISGRAATFNRELNARYEYLSSSTCTTCPLKPVSVLPRSLYIFSDLHPDELAEMGINQDYADYWGKDKIYLTGPTPAIPDNLTILKEIGKSIQEQVVKEGAEDKSRL